MNSPDPDLDALADAWLDGDLDTAQWQALQDQHGKSLAIAEYQARERRAAVANLPRATLPAALRARLLPPSIIAPAVLSSPHSPAPSDPGEAVAETPQKRASILRFPWPIMTTAILAATLVVGVLQLRDWRAVELSEKDAHSHAKTSAPDIARRDSAPIEEAPQNQTQQAAAPAPSSARREQVELAAPTRTSANRTNEDNRSAATPSVATEPSVAAKPAPAAAPTTEKAAASDDAIYARLREEAKRQVATAAASTPPPTATTTPAAAPVPADVHAIGPYALALVRRVPAADADGFMTGPEHLRNSADLADQRDVPQQETDEVAPAAAKSSSEPATPQATAAAADQVDAGPDAGLIVVLYNRTIAGWTIPASQVRIEALDATGTVIWSGRAAAMGNLVVPAGGFVSVDLDSADWPADTHSLRARIDDLRSPALDLSP